MFNSWDVHQISSVSQCSQSLRFLLVWRTNLFLTRLSSESEAHLAHHILMSFFTIFFDLISILFPFYYCLPHLTPLAASTNPTMCSVFTIPDLWGKDLWTPTMSLLWVVGHMNHESIELLLLWKRRVPVLLNNIINMWYNSHFSRLETCTRDIPVSLDIRLCRERKRKLCGWRLLR